MAEDLDRKMLGLIAELSAEVTALRLAVAEIGASLSETDNRFPQRLRDRANQVVLSPKVNQQIQNRIEALLEAIEGARKENQRLGR